MVSLYTDNILLQFYTLFLEKEEEKNVSMHHSSLKLNRNNFDDVMSN